MLDRRSFVAALGTALALPRGGRPDDAAVPSAFYLSACMDPAERGAASVAAFDGDGRLLFETRLPARGHDTVARPGSPEVVVFARRPGNWAAVVDRRTGEVTRVVITPRDRHFFGHGAFSPDGSLLYATENQVATGSGVLGVYDAEAGYVRVDERPTHGLGPHDLAMMSGREGRRMLVANGGTRTHPETGREILNADAMQPGLSLVDLGSGEALWSATLGPALKGLSIRHLALAADGEAAFACQWEGDPLDGPPLVGLVTPDGRARLLDMPDDDLAGLSHYVGSVALDASEQVIAATSPRGGTVAFWERGSGRYLGRRRMTDACGVAPASKAEGLFVVSSGNAGVGLFTPRKAELRRLEAGALTTQAWDNHLLAL